MWIGRSRSQRASCTTSRSHAGTDRSPEPTSLPLPPVACFFAQLRAVVPQLSSIIHWQSLPTKHGSSLRSRLPGGRHLLHLQAAVHHGESQVFFVVFCATASPQRYAADVSLAKRRFDTGTTVETVGGRFVITIRRRGPRYPTTATPSPSGASSLSPPGSDRQPYRLPTLTPTHSHHPTHSYIHTFIHSPEAPVNALSKQA